MTNPLLAQAYPSQNAYTSLHIDTLIKTLENAKKRGEEEIVIHTNSAFLKNKLVIRGKQAQTLLYSNL